MSSPPKWGIVATIKAPLRDIANFAAHHLDLGAHRLLIYLDDDNPAAFERLKQHPKIRVEQADEANWRRARRPVKHQVRQSVNASHAYRRKARDLDWLAHIDVDEFLVPLKPIAAQLEALPTDCLCARVRPVEALSAEGQPGIPPGETFFKALSQDRATRNRQTAALYPTFGAHLNGGFLSHVVGKHFVRTGLDQVDLKIHNVFVDGKKNPGQRELTDTELCHFHAATLEDWLDRFHFRHDRGAYRSDLAPTRARVSGGLTMHEFFACILDSDGELGLRNFYDEVCRSTPELRARLEAHGLLRRYSFDFDGIRAKHFPDLA